MENLSLYCKILEVVVFVFPTIVTILVLVNRKFYMKNLSELKTHLELFEQKTQENTKIILNRLQQQQKILKMLLQNKMVAERLRKITKHAIEYCANSNMSKVLTNTTQHVINFVNSILDQGFDNQTKEQLIARFELSRDNSLAYLRKFVSKQNFNIWLDMQDPLQKNYIKTLIQIYNDAINDKNERFLVVTEDWLQTLTKTFILYTSILKQRKNPL